MQKKRPLKMLLFVLISSIFIFSPICLAGDSESQISQPADITAHFQKLLILDDVTIIDGTGNLPQPSSSIYIEGGKIIRICKKGQFQYPDDAKVITLKNKYVIPGLVDMHAHIFGGGYNKEVCKTLLAFGITTMRCPAAEINEGVELRKKLASGEILGPRLFTAGLALDCPETGLGGDIVRTEEETRQAVRKQIKAGVDYIKLYTAMRPELVKAAIDEAHSLGVKVIGHLGKTSWTYAANAGIDGLVHSAMCGPIWELISVEKRDKFRNLSNPLKSFNPNLFKEWGETFNIDGNEMKELTKALVDNKVAVDPTLVMMEAMIWGDDPNYKEILEPDFAPKDIAKKWRNDKLHPYTSWWPKNAHDEAKKLFSVFSKIVKRFYDNGVLITSGTDLGNPWITPGVSLHREFELLVNAGIPPLEVIKIATQNGAKALNILDEVGTIEVGKQADLVILNANPAENIKNTRKIEYILKNGEFYNPSHLLSNRVTNLKRK